MIWQRNREIRGVHIEDWLMARRGTGGQLEVGVYNQRGGKQTRAGTETTAVRPGDGKYSMHRLAKSNSCYAKLDSDLFWMTCHPTLSNEGSTCASCDLCLQVLVWL